ncbi:MAG: type I restriction enzyme HsdR N-terminal domain-containing protein [Bacteroidetes bacterium]|nr:type I restriction enzyme HsdR N-terminal domain-containing protein [Bacteroidota bacterium]
MQELNLPSYSFKLKQDKDKTYVFDAIRKKYVLLTPEEWVRQHIIQFVIQEKKYPASLVAVEIGLKYNQLQKRADVLVYNTSGKPLLLIECKAPEVKITQEVFHQIALYNMTYKVAYLLVTNGLEHYCCVMDYTNNTYQFLQDIPEYK